MATNGVVEILLGVLLQLMEVENMLELPEHLL